MAEDTGFLVDLFKLGALVGCGVLAYKIYSKWQEHLAEPVIISLKKEGTQEVTINLPPFWIPYSALDTKEGITEKYKPDISLEKPDISIDNFEWVVKFKPISYVGKNGISVSYTPPEKRIPFIEGLKLADLAFRLMPDVAPTASPPGWNITFKPFTVKF